MQGLYCWEKLDASHPQGLKGWWYSAWTALLGNIRKFEQLFKQRQHWKDKRVAQ